MIARAAALLLDWYAGHRRLQLERLWRDPTAVQEVTLKRLVAAARDTEFGLTHGFRGIRSVADYQSHVPVRPPFNAKRSRSSTSGGASRGMDWIAA